MIYKERFSFGNNFLENILFHFLIIFFQLFVTIYKIDLNFE